MIRSPAPPSALLSLSLSALAAFAWLAPTMAGCGGDTLGAAASSEDACGIAQDAGADAIARDDGGSPGDDAGSEGVVSPLANAALLFGGDGPQYFGDTWEWDGGSWIARHVEAPPARAEHAMAALDGKIVLFGGESAGGPLGDTWEWDGRSWTRRDVTGPSPRSRHRMATVGKKIVLFGGLGASGEDCDTWEWDGTRWTPSPATLTTGFHCEGHAMAALGDKLYLFGGIAADSDTWAYDGASWTKVATSGPPGRAFSAMATYGDKIVLFGGEADANHVLADTWEWNGTAWTERASNGPPPPRWHAGLTAFGGALVLFGGDGGNGAGWLGDTWLWNGTTWTPPGNAPASMSPSARYCYTLAAR